MHLGKLFEDIIELDRQNFCQVRGVRGSEFNERIVREILIKNHLDDSLLIFLYQNNLLASYLRFSLFERALTVESFQIRDGYQYALFEMLRKTHEKLSCLDFDLVKSEIYTGNSRALKFNLKLGLSIYNSAQGKWYLSTDKQTFLDSIQRYIKPKAV